MKQFIFIVVISFFLESCVCKYDLRPDKIKSSCAFNYGINISRISVDSFTTDGIPYRFKHDTIITYSPECVRLTKDEVESLSKKGFNYLDTCNVKHTKVIFFNKSNKGYYWYYKKPFDVSTKHELMPINFEKQTWYEISNLYKDGGSPIYFIYFLIEENGNWIIKEITKW